MDNISVGTQLGMWTGRLIAFVVALLFILAPVALGSFLTLAWLRSKKTIWIALSVVAAIPTLIIFAAFCYGAMNGIRNGNATATSSPSSPTLPTSTTGGGSPIQGTNYDYTLRVPDASKWKVDRQDINFDIMVFCRDVYVATAIERIDNRSPQDIVHDITLRLTKLDPNCTFTEPETVKIDGVSWLHFYGRATLRGIKFVYSYHIHGSGNGACRIIAWTSESIFEQEKGTMDQVARSFRFGEKLKQIQVEYTAETTAPATPPATTPEPTTPAEPPAAKPSTSSDPTPAKPLPEPSNDPAPGPADLAWLKIAPR